MLEYQTFDHFVFDMIDLIMSILEQFRRFRYVTSPATYNIPWYRWMWRVSDDFLFFRALKQGTNGKKEN